METIRVIHDTEARLLMIWLQDPGTEPVVETAVDGLVIIRNTHGRVVGIRIPDYSPAGPGGGITVTTTAHSHTMTTSTSHRRG